MKPQQALLAEKGALLGYRFEYKRVCFVWCLALAFLTFRAAAQPLAADRPRIQGALTLKDAIEIGLRENLGLRTQQAEARAAAAEARFARSQTLPQISANSFLSTGDMSALLSSAPGVMPISSNLVPPKGFADQNLTLMVPLFTGGRLQGLVRAARERQQAATDEISETRLEVILQVKSAYYRALLAGEFVKVAQARVEAAQELLKVTRALYEVGKGIEASVLRVEAEVADAQRALTSARNEQAKALLNLKVVMGVRLDSEITLTDILVFAPLQGDLNPYLEEAARNRPAVKAAHARFRAAGAERQAAQGTLLPQVYGMAMGDTFRAQNGTGSGRGSTLGVVLSLPLMDSGERQAMVAKMKALQQRAEAELHQTELRVANEVQQAWLDVQTAEQNYRTAQAALQAAQSAYEVIALRVQAQKSILVEQLDALAALTQARANLAQALYEHLIAAARLQRAIGKG